MAYLLKYDSIYGTMPHSIRVAKDRLMVDRHSIAIMSHKNPLDLDLASLGVDIVLQCSGVSLSSDSNEAFIQQGAKKLIISTPPTDDTPTYIYGVNNKQYRGESIISNSSCSANAIVPIFKIIEKHCGIRGAMMHMFHSYTAYQNLLDANHYSSDIRRARAAAQNIIPLTSSAARATEYFFPYLRDNLYAKSIRIPVASTTMYDLSIKLDGEYELESIKQSIVDEIDQTYSNILDTSTDSLVSSDYIQNTHSATIDMPLLDLAGDNLLRVSAWQDNEYGYAMRLIDMAKAITRS